MRTGAGLVLSLVLALCACGGGEEAEEVRTEPATTTESATTTEAATTTEPATTAEEDEDGTHGTAAGRRIFLSQGCGACHTFEAAGTTGTTGPNLDRSLRGHHAAPAHVREAIVEPNAEITRGFEPDVMPQNYDERLSDEQIDALVAFLTERHEMND